MSPSGSCMLIFFIQLPLFSIGARVGQHWHHQNQAPNQSFKPTPLARLKSNVRRKSMRTHGTLSKWNDDKGFGFIRPADGEKEIFVHISAFPRDGVRLKVGEVISFEQFDSPDGKKKAQAVMRPGSTRAKPLPYSPKRAKKDGSSISLIAVVLGVIAIGGYGFSKLDFSDSHTDVMPYKEQAQFTTQTVKAKVNSSFTCDGRQHCSQMRSCEEATFFISHCPNTKMDGDGDGVPCEDQHCR